MKRLLFTTSAFFILASGACHRDRLQTRGPSDLEGEEAEVVVEAMWDEEPRNVIEIPDLLNPYEDDLGGCSCCCATKCGGDKSTSEFEDFVTGLKDKATAKAAAAADSLLAAGPDLVKQEGWKEMAVDAVDLLGNPILVVVQLPSGKWQKATFEALPEIDVDPVEAFMIRKSVGDKMQAALKAVMMSHGMDEPAAGLVARKIIKAYLKKISP